MRDDEKTGALEVVTGVMFAGKTTYLLHQLREAASSDRRVVAFKPAIDTRYATDAFVSHDGDHHPAFPIPADVSRESTLKEVAGEAFQGAEVVGFDEANFFSDAFVDVCQELRSRGILVIVSGAHIDFARRPFGPMQELMALADSVVIKQTRCWLCGKEATCYQRLLNGRPAPLDGPLVMLGGAELYEPRCTQCYESERDETSRQEAPRELESHGVTSSRRA
jgi:thymidine kinase